MYRHVPNLWGFQIEMQMPRTGLLEEPPSGVWRVFSSAGIDVEHKKKVDLGVLRGAECHGHVPAPPFSTVDRVCVKQVSSLR